MQLIDILVIIQQVAAAMQPFTVGTVATCFFCYFSFLNNSFISALLRSCWFDAVGET